MDIFNPFKRYKERLISIVRVYDEMLFTSKVKHRSNDTNFVNPERGYLGIDFSAIHDREKITYIYLVYKYPSKLSIDYKKTLRKQCVGESRLHFLAFNRPHVIEWSSQRMKGRLEVLKQVSQSNGDKETDAYSHHEDNNKIANQNRLEESLMYFADAEKLRERTTFKHTGVFILTGKRGEDMDDSSRSLETEAKKMGFVIERVMYDVAETLGYYSPFTRQMKHPNTDLLPTQVITDEHLARQYLYEQGTIGNRGVYFGSDIKYKYPVLKVIKQKSTSAETIVVVAETGGGKSNFIKNVLLQLLNKPNFIATLMDIEGYEYTPLTTFVGRKAKVLRLNMAQGSGKYYDPVEIPDLTGNKEIDDDLYTVSNNYTLGIMNILAGKLVDTDDFVPNLIKKGVSEFYTGLGVDYDNPDTWGKTKGKRLHDVYLKIKEYTAGQITGDALHEKKLAVDKLMLALGDAFEKGGTMAHIFKEPVNVVDIIQAKVVQCAFGMAGKSEKIVDPVSLGLMQLFAAALSHVRSVYAKAQGLYNVKVWEEFQRWGKFKNSDSTIGTAITGGRKLGDVNIIITNDVGIVLKDDKFSILSNYSSMIVGAVADEKVRAELAVRISYPQMKSVMDEIAAAAKKEDDLTDFQREKIIAGETGENRYTYSFLTILDRSRVAISKLIMNPEVVDTPLFKTGIQEKTETFV